MYGKHHTEETRHRIKNKKIEYYSNGGEHPKGMLGKTHTDEVKQKIKESVTKNSAMRGKTGIDHPTGGTVWWNNGTEHKRSIECPGEGWVIGRIFKKRNRNNIK